MNKTNLNYREEVKGGQYSSGKCMAQIIGRGAEAILLKEGDFLVKHRIKKSYRLSILDKKLRKSRTKHEAKLLEKSSSLISVPKILETDKKEKITMQFIEGKKLSEHLDTIPKSEKICEKIGKSISLLHDSDIIHGDLTTSNMIYVESQGNKNNTPNNKTNQHYKTKREYLLANRKNNISIASEHFLMEDKEDTVYFIDFGLGFHSKRIEDKAVDLHLLKQALEAKHFLHWKKLFSAVIRGYKSKDKTKILEQLKKVEARGRYKKGF